MANEPHDKDRDEAPRIGSGYRDWEWAAHRLGEMMCADGPKGYYLFTPQQLVDWASSLPSRTVPESGALENVLRLADELRDAVDNEAEDIGGSRPSLEIVRDLASAVDAAKAVSGCGTNEAAKHMGDENDVLLTAALMVMEQWDGGLDEDDGQRFESAQKDWNDLLAALRDWKRQKDSAPASATQPRDDSAPLSTTKHA